MTFGAVAAFARRRFLAPLAGVAQPMEPRLLDTLFRPLGGVFLARWFAAADAAMPEADALTLAAAHRMLQRWIEASDADTTVVPAELRGDSIEATARAVLRRELRDWANR